MSTDYFEKANSLRPAMVALRRDLHQHPEIAFEEVRTAGIVARRLQELGLEVQTGIGKTGVVGIIEGDHDGPTVLIRADMDALPMQENNTADYISTIPGKMHACGHDGHTSIGLAVAEMLSERRHTMKGRIKFVFQPAEETGLGAKAMIADGVLTAPSPDVTLGLHLWNVMPLGKLGVTPGPMMAASDIWHMTITGYGGHAASPHETRDPVVAAAQIITALQTITSRNTHPLDAAVVSVATVHAGDAFNIIPADVKMSGTVRTYQKETQELVHRRFREICEGIAQAMQCSIDLEITKDTIAVNNNIDVTRKVSEIAASIVGPDNILDDVRTMGAEDVSFLMDDIPGCYFFVGSASTEKGLDYPHHNPRFDFDEEAMVIGAAVLANAAASYVLPE